MAVPSTDSDFRVKLEFRKVLNNVSEGLSTKNLTTLKFLCHDKISERAKEEVQTGRELFDLLQEKGTIYQTEWEKCGDKFVVV